MPAPGAPDKAPRPCLQAPVSPIGQHQDVVVRHAVAAGADSAAGGDMPRPFFVPMPQAAGHSRVPIAFFLMHLRPPLGIPKQASLR